MAQYLAIEWDARESRVAVARVRGKEFVVEHAFAVALDSRDSNSPAEAPMGEKLTRELRLRGIGRVDTLVSVGRANIELRQISLPAAPENELPELVRFQALRQFTTIGEEWPIDFVQLKAAEGDSLSVLVAAISPEIVAQIRTTCESANLVPKRLVFRPFAAASLLRRYDAVSRLRRRDAQEHEPCRLMVDLLTEEADLTVLDDQQVLLTRTVRLHSPDDREAQAKGLLGEIRRTIAAANNQLGPRRVEKVILCGDGSEHDAIRSLIEQELTLEVELFDPFSEVRLGSSLAAGRPRHSGRFAPLLGLLHDESMGSPHAIDFLHPRKKIEQVDLRRRGILVGAVLAVAALAILLSVWIQLRSLDTEIADLELRSSQLKKAVDEAEKLRKDEAAIQEFANHNLNWLDELYVLAERLPPADDVVVTRLDFDVVQPRGGELQLEGYTREPTQFQQIEERLRSQDRTVTSGTKPNDMKRDKHRFGFSELVRVPPSDAQEKHNSGDKSDSAKGVLTAGGAASHAALPAKAEPAKGDSAP